MDQAYFQQVLLEGLYLVLLLSAPCVAASVAIGLVTSVFQATTQLQDQAISLVPRMIVVFAALALFGPWIGAQLLRFALLIYQGLPLIR